MAWPRPTDSPPRSRSTMQTRGFRSGTIMAIAGLAVPLSLDAQLGVQRERNVPAVYAITNARIVPGTGPVIDRGTVVLRNGLITAVGASAATPADARVIDGTGL